MLRTELLLTSLHRYLTSAPIHKTYETRDEIRTVQLIGATSFFLQVRLAQVGAAPAFLPLCPMTEHSSAKWRSMRTLGSLPGANATGVLHSGQSGAMRSWADASYEGHE